MQSITKYLNKYREYFIFGIIYLIIFLLVTNMGKYYFVSKVDALSQHIPLMDLLRSNIYSGKLSDFLYNLACGDSIYSIAYYGLFSPILILSLFFPFIKMITLLPILVLLLTYFSSILLYKWILHHSDKKTAIIVTIIYILSGCFLHLHRHFMFINYFLFLILGLISIDKNKRLLLTFSLVMIALSSFYYIIPSYLVLGIYIIHILYMNKKLTVFNVLEYIPYFLLAITMTSILTIPTFYHLLSNRAKVHTSINLLAVITDIRFHSNYFIYNSYGIGLTMIAIYALIYNFIKNKRMIILTLSSLLILIFPIFNYLMNGTMYIDSKILIPFLPILLYLIMEFLKEIESIDHTILLITTFLSCILILNSQTINWLIILIRLIDLLIIILVVYKTKKYKSLIYLLLLVPFISSVIIHKLDSVVSVTDYQNKYYKSYKTILPLIPKEKYQYRISNSLYRELFVNEHFNLPNYLSPNIYSSIENQNYSKYIYDEINTEIIHRNRAILNAGYNPFSLITTSSKYVISKLNIGGYSKLNTKVQFNNNIIPFIYYRDRNMNINDYEQLNFNDKRIALISSIISKDDTNYKIKNYYKKLNIPKNKYRLSLDKVTYKEFVLDKDNHNKTLIIRFRMGNIDNRNDTSITINGVKNKLTVPSWKYHNHNYIFDYVVQVKDKVRVKLSKGNYLIENIEVYSLDNSIWNEYYKDIHKIKTSDLTNINVDIDKPRIIGTTLVYSPNIEVYDNNKKISTMNINKTFLGFKLNKGKHKIKIIYRTKYLKISLYITVISILIYLTLILKSVIITKRAK